MSLLNTVLGALGQQSGGAGGNPLLQIVLGMLSNGQGGGQAGGGLGGLLGSALGGGGGMNAAQGGGAGGLGALIEQFSRNGMGEQMQSWIGTGQNMPISPDQLTQVLGSDQIGSIAQQLGVSPNAASGQLAELLPQVIDRLTPNGSVPQGGLGDIGSLLSMLGGSQRG